MCIAENEWNPIEWDRAAEELTWERVSGPDINFIHNLKIVK